MKGQRWVKFDEVLRAVQERTGIATNKQSLVGARLFADALFQDIFSRVMAGEQVNVPEFGIFKPTTRKQRRVLNPITKEIIQLPAFTTIRLQPPKKLKRVGAAEPKP